MKHLNISKNENNISQLLIEKDMFNLEININDVLTFFGIAMSLLSMSVSHSILLVQNALLSMY